MTREHGLRFMSQSVTKLNRSKRNPLRPDDIPTQRTMKPRQVPVRIIKGDGVSLKVKVWGAAVGDGQPKRPARRKAGREKPYPGCRFFRKELL